MSASRFRFRSILIALTLAALTAMATTGPATALTWGAATAITTSGDAERPLPPSLVATGPASAAVIYEETDAGTPRVWLRRTTDSGANWSLPMQLSRPNAVAAFHPRLAAYGPFVDATWVEERLDGTLDIVYRRSDDRGATWFAPRRLYNTTGDLRYPAVGRDQGDRVAVGWIRADTGVLRVRVSTDDGATFNSAVTIGSSANQPFLSDGDDAYVGFPTITFGGGYVQVGWLLDDSTIGLKRSLRGGRVWADNPQILATNADGDSPPQLAARGDDILLAYVREGDGQRQAVTRLSKTSGSGWGAPVPLTALKGPDSFAPTVAFREQLWHVSYSRCETEDCAESRVFYKNGVSGDTWLNPDPVSLADHGPEALNGGVTAAGRVMVVYGAGEEDGQALDLYVRRTAADGP